MREEGEGEKEGRDAWHIAYHATNVGHVRSVRFKIFIQDIQSNVEVNTILFGSECNS